MAAIGAAFSVMFGSLTVPDASAQSAPPAGPVEADGAQAGPDGDAVGGVVGSAGPDDADITRAIALVGGRVTRDLFQEGLDLARLGYQLSTIWENNKYQLTVRLLRTTCPRGQLALFVRQVDLRPLSRFHLVQAEAQDALSAQTKIVVRQLLEYAAQSPACWPDDMDRPSSEMSPDGVPADAAARLAAEGAARASEEYRRQFLQFRDDFSVSASTEHDGSARNSGTGSISYSGTSTTTVTTERHWRPCTGETCKPLSDAMFFEALGRDDLAEEHRRKLRATRKLYLVGGVVGVTGLVFAAKAFTEVELVGADDPRCPAFLANPDGHLACADQIQSASERRAGRWAIAAGVALVGGSSLAVIGKLKARKRVVSEIMAKEMAEDYNQKLRERLGVHQAHRAAPFVKTLAVSPSYDPYSGSAGVALAGSF